ncbi:protein STICHEL-like 3 [Andrographis paniculata]|uniref:protein STICHEL-like 3 n=1 Tax=Andrographis paniculata TaxID=175694 RepID=UPI0021E82837|nr:protein STICHEL-like 3 [Andrographis paniculata]
MTKAARDRILKDVNGDISDHLRNHIHLTNCIHLKNHMHKHSPILADRALMRDLVVLQRSRSLRDPSASPPSWQSPAVADLVLGRGEAEDIVGGRQSVSIERPRQGGRMSGGTPPFSGRLSRRNDGVAAGGAASEQSSKDGNDVIHDGVSRGSELRDWSAKVKGGYRQDKHLTTLSEKLKDVPAESNDAVSSHNYGEGSHNQIGKAAEQAGINISHGSSLNRGKRRRFRGARRSRPARTPRETETQNEMSVASNSFAQGRAPHSHEMREEFQGFDGQNVTGVPRNGCGIPWNWSRIHHRGKSFIDMAGRSLSCGLSDSRFNKRGGSGARGMEGPGVHVMSEFSSSSTKSDGEALPLLLDASGSQGSIGHARWIHDYSGELGIYVDNLLKPDTDSDLASEGRSHERDKFSKHHNERHQNLTQKYMPRMFKDLVGQNLVVQALSNAVVRRKVSLLYLFYGPHGTGKTSCARIFARSLNCQSVELPRPCDFCNSCIAHNAGKSRSLREIGPVSNIDFEGIIDLLDSFGASQVQSQYRVLIFDECDTLSSECWSAILKVVDRAPRRVIFVLVCSSLEAIPHVVVSRCQKFFFPKLKDADIIYTLQWIATKEGLEIDKDALKLIALRSDGSLRDAEMTLEQLSLLGKRISLSLVQELVGLISDEKLIDLLDSALSADTVNTVKNLRDIMESGVEPMALMSQLATVITDVLAGSYDLMKEWPKRKFFRRQTLSKEDMEKLRQALKTLSEAEKQLRVSNDRITWLTAALLQLAPDQQYILPSSSTDTSLDHSPLVLNTNLRERHRKSNAETLRDQRGLSGNAHYNRLKGPITNGNETNGRGAAYKNKEDQLQGRSHQQIEEIWLEVLERIPIRSAKELMQQEGKLASLSYGAAPTVQLLFSSQQAKSKAEKFRLHILQAFESVLRSPVTIEIRCDTRKDAGLGPILLPAPQKPSHYHADGMPMFVSLPNRDASSSGLNRREIVEMESSPRRYEDSSSKDEKAESNRGRTENSGLRSAQKVVPLKLGDKNPSLSLVRGKVSLAHVIQEGRAYHNGWSKQKAISIAEKIEQENLRLESRSRRLLCWNPPKSTRRKLSRLKIRTRKPQTLLKFVSCGRCLSGRSPRSRLTPQRLFKAKVTLKQAG